MVRCLNDDHGEAFAAYCGDAVEVCRQLPDASIGMGIYSPPFSSLYIYSDSIADMGNSAGDAEFREHYGYLVRELYRLVAPGRIVVVHCKDIVYYKNQGGTAGLRDFPGLLIQAHVDAGFDFHSRVTIWRCPVREMTKTKARGLLYKQLRADSSYSRQGLPEYLLVFRRWPKTEEEEAALDPVVHMREDFPLDRWQEWASPVWHDTNTMDVLNTERQEKDEKHICPMPLDLITRSITLWSNPGDTVLSPFMGIGSEGYMALKLGRRFVGIELKESYWKQAVEHLHALDTQGDLFASAAP